MPTEPRSPRLAVLIDADNASAKIADGLFEEIAKIGEASVRRIYGDFSSARSKAWADIAVEACHHPAAAIRLHHRQERVRHNAGDRCDGPASQRPLRRLLPGVVGQRFHTAGFAHQGAGRRCVRVRRAEDAGEFSPGVPEVRLYRKPAAAGAGQQPGCELDEIASASRCRHPDPREGDRADGERGRLGVAGRRSAPGSAIWRPTSIPGLSVSASSAIWCARPMRSRSISARAARCASASSRWRRSQAGPRLQGLGEPPATTQQSPAAMAGQLVPCYQSGRWRQVRPAHFLQSARSVCRSNTEARIILMSICTCSPGRLTSCACNSAMTGAPARLNVA